MHFQELRILSLLVRIKEYEYEKTARRIFGAAHSKVGIFFAAVICKS